MISTPDRRRIITLINEAVRFHWATEIIKTDQGSQFISDAFVAAVATSGARLSMDGKGAWTDNILSSVSGAH